MAAAICPAQDRAVPSVKWAKASRSSLRTATSAKRLASATAARGSSAHAPQSLAMCTNAMSERQAESPGLISRARVSKLWACNTCSGVVRQKCQRARISKSQCSMSLGATRAETRSSLCRYTGSIALTMCAEISACSANMSFSGRSKRSDHSVSPVVVSTSSAVIRSIAPARRTLPNTR